jgi:hypothetical protein
MGIYDTGLSNLLYTRREWEATNLAGHRVKNRLTKNRYGKDA